MKLKTNKDGNLELYTEDNILLNPNYIRNISFDSGDQGISQVLTATVEVVLSSVDMEVYNKMLDKNIDIFSVCPECGKKSFEACEHEKEGRFAKSIELAVRYDSNKAFGYVHRVQVTQGEEIKPKLLLEKYELDENKKVCMDENNEPKLFVYSE